MAYANRDPNERRARKVKPVDWVRFGEQFKAYCFTDEFEKTYDTHKIRRIKDQPWMVEAATKGTYL
jgi:hypothetical protein